MRRAASRRANVLFAATCLAAASQRLAAQSNSGAVDLLVPIGARATAMGSAYAAEEGGSAIWYNPAGLGRLSAPELAYDNFKTFFIDAHAGSLIVAAKGVGSIGLSVRYFDFGSTDITDENGQPFGSARTSSLLLGATFATNFGSRVTAGVTYRQYRLTQSCLGICAQRVAETYVANAVDAGVQFRPLTDRPLQFGLALTGIGRDFQVKNQAQADALPARVHLGASYVASLQQGTTPISLRFATEVLATPSLELPELHLGTELAYDAPAGTLSAKAPATSLFARAGYVTQQATGAPSATGPSIGIGIRSGRIQLDYSRIFEQFSSELGRVPTYVSFRVGL
ncbi:MAG: PorV/PorQ family protein [Gemmatimonadaceae bacterium]|nr:PorV/PorQ family protein [Gemmatimonadaceae bacterium]